MAPPSRSHPAVSQIYRYHCDTHTQSRLQKGKDVLFSLIKILCLKIETLPPKLKPLCFTPRTKDFTALASA